MPDSDLFKRRFAGAAGYGVALLSVLLAVALRAALDPVLLGTRPFVLVAGGVAVAVWLARWRAAAVAAAAGFVATEIFLIPPQSPETYVTLLEDAAVYGISCIVVIAVVEALHRGNDRADEEIAARKRTEIQLRELQQRLTLAIDAAFAISFEWDIQRDEVRRFMSHEPALPATPEDKPARFEMVCSAVHPEDRAEFRANIDAALAAEHGLYSNEYRVLHPDGSIAWLSERGRVLRDSAGKPSRLIGVTQDITERKAAEETRRRGEARFRRIYEHAATGIAITDWEGRFLQCNPAYSRLVGYTEDELRKLRIGDLIHPDDRPENMRLIERMLAGELQAFDIENRYARKDGDAVWVQKYVSVLPGRSGKPAYIMALVTDMTERRRAADALARANEQLTAHARHLDSLVEQRTSELRDVAQQLETFSYSIAHDLRAPLRTMRNFAELLEQEYGPKLDPTAHDYIARIMRSAVRMDQLITDVLAYSRVTRSDAPLSDVSLDQLVSEIVDGYPQFHEQATAITVQRPLPLVRGNAALLTQVLSNLIGNALKFVPRGQSPRVTVGSEPNGARVRIWVKDQGIGIPREYHSKLFGVFQRLHAASEYPGTGVGLATVKKAVERMGGQVGFESEPGVGTRFWFDLEPAARSSPETARS